MSEIEIVRESERKKKIMCEREREREREREKVVVERMNVRTDRPTMFW